MNKKKTKDIIAQISKCKQNIAKERDKLRELMADAEEICSNADEALYHIDAALDELSYRL